MKLMTKALEKKFAKFPIGSQDGRGTNAEIVVKYFNPRGAATWLITEGERCEDGDWMLYGFVRFSRGWGWRYVSLADIESVCNPIGLGMERDLYLPDGITVNAYFRAYCREDDMFA